MKTAHQLARELLALPDMPVFHFDPSCAGFNADDDTSIGEPRAEVVDDLKDDAGQPLPMFLTIVGDQHELHGLEKET